jgi:hypothetical protein
MRFCYFFVLVLAMFASLGSAEDSVVRKRFVVVRPRPPVAVVRPRPPVAVVRPRPPVVVVRPRPPVVVVRPGRK